MKHLLDALLILVTIVVVVGFFSALFLGAKPIERSPFEKPSYSIAGPNSGREGRAHLIFDGVIFYHKDAWVHLDNDISFVVNETSMPPGTALLSATPTTIARIMPQFLSSHVSLRQAKVLVPSEEEKEKWERSLAMARAIYAENLRVHRSEDMSPKPVTIPDPYPY